MIPRPHVDWFALAPELVLLGAMAFALMGAVLLPRENRRDFGALAAALGFAGAFVYAIVVYVHTPDVHSVIADSVRRDRFGALAQVIVCVAGVLGAGLEMLMVGLGFQASAAPFHMWTPDVYEGAPTPVTGFMAAATKTAALVLTLRVLREAFPQEAHLWTIALAAIACASLLIGNLAALVQRSVKRMLAYSSISHAGFMLIPIAADRKSVV